MPTKYLDLTDLQEDSLEMTLPFKNAEGADASRKVTIKDPSVSAMLVAEKLQDEVDKAKKTKNIDAMRSSLQEQVYELLRINNEVTREEVNSLSFAILLKISSWVSEHIKGVFLGDSPKRNTNASSENKTDDAESENQSNTKSSDSVS